MNKDLILECLKSELRMHPLKVFNIFLYGSQVYGTATPESDWDFTIIARNSVENIEHQVTYKGYDFNFHIQTPDYFQSQVDWNSIKPFEMILRSKEQPILETKEFEINIVNKKFRHAVSQQSSNSWVKAMKKVSQGDVYIGQKSLYHSLRMPMFATQVMETGKINDWGCTNIYWDDIKSITDASILKKKYQPIRNEIMTKFRELCPKE